MWAGNEAAVHHLPLVLVHVVDKPDDPLMSRERVDELLEEATARAGDAAAVDLAFRLAAARQLSLTAYHCLWDVIGPDDFRDVAADEPGYEAERELLARAVETGARSHPDVQVRLVLSRGFADQRLIQASRTADIVVVGHRRKRFLNELIYGSAAPRVVAHAPCPVAVVPFKDQSQDRVEETGADSPRP